MLRDAAAKKTWSSTLDNRRMQLSDRIRNPSVWSQLWDKTSSRVFLFIRIGTLRFRETWRGYYEAKGEDVNCPSNLCGMALDTFEHMKVYGFYNTQWKEEYKLNPKSLVNYVRAASASIESDKSWRLPLF